MKSVRTAAPPAYSIEAAMPYLLNRIVNRLNRRLVEQLKAQGMTFRDWRVLAFLAATERRTIVELAEYSVIPHSTLSRLLDRMERNGLVTRSSAPHDLRAVALSLTAAGRRRYARILPLALELNGELMRGFSAAERRTLAALLGRMRDNLGLDGAPAASPSGSAARSRSRERATAARGARRPR
jgi:DNA-binding MarR family transcriptional regulator